MRRLPPKLLLSAITIAALAPFLDKAFHIDDPLFLWMAQRITKHPLDPYGFAVNWTSSLQPMWMVMQNPPLCSYIMAAVGVTLGWSEVAMHLAFILPSVGVVLGTFALAKRLCPEPTMTALLALFTPVFLVSATNIMCDVTLLACWVWSVELWLAGLDRNRLGLLLLSVSLASAAVLTKYFGIALVPLLAAYTIVRFRRLCPQLVFLLLPVGVAVAYEFWSNLQYGRGMFSGAMTYARTTSATQAHSWLVQLLIGLSFSGGGLISVLFFGQLRSRKLLVVGLGTILTWLAAFYFFAPLPDFVSPNNRTIASVEGAIFAGIGSTVLGLAVVDLIDHTSAERALLALWIIGTFFFASFCNWSVTGRTILPMVPAVAILVGRRAGRFSDGFLRYWPVATAAAVSLLIAVADYRQANSAREAAYSFQDRFGRGNTTVWFQSHWGFQYYMQSWGAKSWEASARGSSGDLIIVPMNSTPLVQMPLERVVPSEKVSFGTVPFVTTFAHGTGACFYSSVRGPLPWGIESVPPEIYYIARLR